MNEQKRFSLKPDQKRKNGQLESWPFLLLRIFIVYGTSVTNAVESIAAQICDFYKVDGADVVLIKHYPDACTPRERAAGASDEMFEEHFSAVNFGQVERTGDRWNFRLPRWAPLELVQVETLIGDKLRAQCPATTNQLRTTARTVR